MLVLARREGERVRVGSDIWITVLEIHEHTIRLGFDAPDTVPILREEIIGEGENVQAV